MLLIGFGHKARQGKNTAAVAVLNAMPVDCRARIYAYADALRREVRNATAGGTEEFIRRGWFVGDHSHQLGGFRAPRVVASFQVCTSETMRCR